MTLVQNETFDIVNIATVEELPSFRSPDSMNSESLSSDDAQRILPMMCYSYDVIGVIPEAIDLVSRLYFLFLLIYAWHCPE